MVYVSLPSRCPSASVVLMRMYLRRTASLAPPGNLSKYGISSFLVHVAFTYNSDTIRYNTITTIQKKEKYHQHQHQHQPSIDATPHPVTLTLTQ